jgi:parallel beta-helix repeat protein
VRVKPSTLPHAGDAYHGDGRVDVWEPMAPEEAIRTDDRGPGKKRFFLRKLTVGLRSHPLLVAEGPMRKIDAFLTAVAVGLPLAAHGTDVSGDVWGTWTKENSPYNVIGEIRVPPESTLLVAPGVVVDFQGHYGLLVDRQATLQAMGTATDSIRFTAEDTAAGWRGLRFMFADSHSTMEYCRVERGKATGSWPDSYGGAIYCSHSNPTISNSSICENYADGCGGAIACWSANPVIRGNTLSGNSALQDGGGISCDWYSNPVIVDNTLTRNSAGENGGGIFCHLHSDATLTGNSITRNDAAYGGGIFCWLSSPMTSDNSIDSNSVTSAGGGIYCDSSSAPTISSNTVTANYAGSVGGGVVCASSSPAIRSNSICRNVSSAGGGVYCWHSSPTMWDNVIVRNTAPEGGGIYCFESSPAIVNNTLSANDVGGIWCFGSSPQVLNTILWGDLGPPGLELYGENSSPAIAYCDVQGGWVGTGNLDADPRFRSAAGGDYHLAAVACGDPQDSPCVDSGHPDSLDALLDCLHGLGAWRADMGAYGGSNSGWPTGLEEEHDGQRTAPRRVLLHPNCPNPFVSATVLGYELPMDQFVRLEIYNIVGQKVVTLVNEEQHAGYRCAVWRSTGHGAGLYFYRLSAGDHTETGRMLMLR